MDYAASHEEPVLTFLASNMILDWHSDGSYFSKRNESGHWFLSNDSPVPSFNSAILSISQIIKAVMSSAAKAKLGALYVNARKVVYI